MTTKNLNIPTERQAERAWLKRCSDVVKPRVGASKEFPSVNAFLTARYQKVLQVKHLHTESEWGARGYRLKQGVQGLPIWGRQRKTQAKDSSTTYTFFPIVHLFHEKDVEKISQGNEVAKTA